MFRDARPRPTRSCTACSSSRNRSRSSRRPARAPLPKANDALTPTEAAAVLKETFGVEPTREGSLLTVPVPPELWHELGRLAKAQLGCLYFNWLSETD